MVDDIDYHHLIKCVVNDENTLCRKKIVEWLRERKMSKRKYVEVCNVLHDLGYKLIVPISQTWSKELIDDLKLVHNTDISELEDLALSSFDESIDL